MGPERRVRTGGRNWRSSPTILERMHEVEIHVAKGWTSHRIAAALGCAESTVRNDIGHLTELWLERVGRAQDELRAERVAQLDVIRELAFGRLPQDGSQALSVARQAVMDAAKLLGLVVDKQEQTAQVILRGYVGDDLDQL